MRYLFAAIAIACAAVAQAQDGAAYYGLQLGAFNYEEEAGPGFSGLKDSPTSWRAMIGYQFSDHLGVEGGWGKTGGINDTATLSGLGTLNYHSEFSSILIVRLLGVLPLDNFRLMGGLGWADMKQKESFSINTGPTQSVKSSGGEATYFAGAQYDWERFALRLGYEKFDFGGDVNVDETSITFWYKL